jgi:tetratricopeptide (TPR) repeat protein
MRELSAARSLLPILLLVAGCRKAPPPKSAHDYYVEAKLAYQVEQWEQAREGFESSYLLKPDPALLFDLGQVNRHLGRLDDALRNYRDYLEAFPDAPNRAAVEKLIVETKRQAGRR